MIADLGGGYWEPAQVVGDTHLTSQEIKSNEKIADARGAVERAILKAKRFKILTAGFPLSLDPMVDDILYF